MLKRWKIINSKPVFNASPWFKVLKQRILLPNGKIIDNYHWIEVSDYSIIFAQLEDGRVIMERQYKHGVGAITLVLPAGGVAKNELPLACAQRELLEETGYVSNDWCHLGTFVHYGNNSSCKVHIFSAKDAKQIDKPKSGDLEDMELKFMTIEEVVHAVNQGEIVTLGTVTAVALALNSDFKRVPEKSKFSLAYCETE